MKIGYFCGRRKSSHPTKIYISVDVGKHLCQWNIQSLLMKESISVDEDISSPLIKEIITANDDIPFSLTGSYSKLSDRGCYPATIFADQGGSYNPLTIKPLLRPPRKGIELQFLEFKRESNKGFIFLHKQVSLLDSQWKERVLLWSYFHVTLSRT